MIDINEYLTSSSGATLTDKIGVTKLNEILPNGMPNSWSKISYVQGFDCESIILKKAVNTFERMEIAESIYERVVTTFYNIFNWVNVNHTGHRRQKRGESDLSKKRPEKGESSGKRRKRPVDSSMGKSKTCLINYPGHYLKGCKILEDFGNMYTNSRPTKDLCSSPVYKKTLTRNRKTTPSLTMQ